MPTPDPGYLPKPWEFGVMLVIASLAWLLGYMIRQRFAPGRADALPVPVAVLYLVAIFAGFAATVFVFSISIPGVQPATYDLFSLTPAEQRMTGQYVPETDRRMVLGFWSILVWVLPLFRAISWLREATATDIVDKIGPFSARIEDPSEFAGARKLAMRGDIDGAVLVYRNYRENACDALFEAARLLKSEDRYAEAADLFREIAEKFQERKEAWADAVYQLGKFDETIFRTPKSAMLHYREIIARAPKSRFAQLAATDLARLQVLDDDFAEELVDVPRSAAVKDPFFDKRAAASDNGSAARAKDDDDIPVPGTDPFFAARKREWRGPAAAEKPASAKKKPAAKAKPAEVSKQPSAKAGAAKPTAAKAKASPSAKSAKSAKAATPASPKAAAAKPAAKKPAAKKKPAK